MTVKHGSVPHPSLAHIVSEYIRVNGALFDNLGVIFGIDQLEISRANPWEVGLGE